MSVWIEKHPLFWELLSRWLLCACVAWRPVVCVGFVSAQTACHAQSAEMHPGVFNWEAVSEARLWFHRLLQQSLNLAFLVRIVRRLHWRVIQMYCDVLVSQFWGYLWTVYVQLKVFLLVGFEALYLLHMMHQSGDKFGCWHNFETSSCEFFRVLIARCLLLSAAVFLHYNSVKNAAPLLISTRPQWPHLVTQCGITFGVC